MARTTPRTQPCPVAHNPNMVPTLCAVDTAPLPAPIIGAPPTAQASAAIWRALCYTPHRNRAACVQANAIHAQLRKAGMPRSVCRSAALAVLPQRASNVQATSAAQQTAQPAQVSSKSRIPILHTRATAAHAGAVTYSGNAAQLGKGNGGKHGATRAGDLPWCACKVAVLQGLLAAGATDASRCVTAQTVVNATNGALASAAAAANNRAPLTTLVRHFAYHAGANAAPWTVTVTNAFGRAHGFYITPAGVQALHAYLGSAASA